MARPLIAAALCVLSVSASAAQTLNVVGAGTAASVIVDPQDALVVSVAANLFAEDVRRVTGTRLTVSDRSTSADAIIAGTMGHSAVIDRLIAAGKLPGAQGLQGKWETTLMQVVDDPMPGVKRAMVIVGSDRRGAAYGLMELSEKIGVSPWYWWSDVPVRHQGTLDIQLDAAQTTAPAVRYRGIFINDEDWGLNPWASKTFDPGFGNVGPKTYAKVFELLLRLRLNYVWPAMHACSREFGSDPANAALADTYGIVAGASHCEPMLFNNVHWNEKTQGAWNYSTNRDAVHAIWEKTAAARGGDEAVWTLGIRGIHDAAMETPPHLLEEKRALLNRVIADQRALLAAHATRQYGPVAQCFVPYKEVLPIYDAGLNVPEDVTLVWVDDNFGYIRRVGSPTERLRRGGSGVYWHLSYYGSPHSYTWIDTTAPALMWEELHKAWENDVRTLWIVNVGDIKPMELGIDYFARLAWNPEGYPLGGQKAFLTDHARRTFGEAIAAPMADLLGKFYRLGTIHKPELMDRAWALSLTPARADELSRQYQELLDREQAVRAAIPPAAIDAYTETVGFPAQVLGKTGLIFLADRRAQLQPAGTARPAAQQDVIMRLRTSLESQVVEFNAKVAGGKWNRMMPGLDTGTDLTKWSSQVLWPWGERDEAAKELEERNSVVPPTQQPWRDAADGSEHDGSGAARWQEVEGLGVSGRAMVLTPAALTSSWKEGDAEAPALGYNFETKQAGADLYVEYLPTFRIYPGMKQRVALSVDGQPATLVEVPGSSGAENEQGAVRQFAVQDNTVRSHTPFPALPAGHHTLRIQAIDPGVAIDRVSLPSPP